MSLLLFILLSYLLNLYLEFILLLNFYFLFYNVLDFLSYFWLCSFSDYSYFILSYFFLYLISNFHSNIIVDLIS